MIGAGQYNNPYQQMGMQPGMQPGMYPGMYQGPTFQPMLLPSTPFGSNNINIELDELTLGAGLLQAGGMVGGLANQIMNTFLASDAMGKQADIADKYYSTQQNIASYQQEVALRQLEIYDNSLLVQQRMHKDQMGHEENMAKLESKTQGRLARIAEDGRTDRAKILSVSDAFSRRGWDYGLPSFLS